MKSTIYALVVLLGVIIAAYFYPQKESSIEFETYARAHYYDTLFDQYPEFLLKDSLNCVVDTCFSLNDYAFVTDIHQNQFRMHLHDTNQKHYHTNLLGGGVTSNYVLKNAILTKRTKSDTLFIIDILGKKHSFLIIKSH